MLASIFPEGIMFVWNLNRSHVRLRLPNGFNGNIQNLLDSVWIENEVTETMKMNGCFFIPSNQVSMESNLRGNINLSPNCCLFICQLYYWTALSPRQQLLKDTNAMAQSAQNLRLHVDISGGDKASTSLYGCCCCFRHRVPWYNVTCNRSRNLREGRRKRTRTIWLGTRRRVEIRNGYFFEPCSGQ